MPCILPSSTMTARSSTRAMLPVRSITARVAPRRVRVMSAQLETQQRINQHPDPDFIKETLAKFPEEGIANIEQCLVLYLEGGYKILNVCSERERDFGAIRGSIHVPYTKDKKSWIDNQMKIEKTKVDPATFLKAVNAKIPKKDTKLIVHDMIGKQAVEVLEMLFEDGYENIVGMKGGFKPWFKTFDFNLRRRNFGEYQENYNANDQLGMGDSCGVHASGAGFQNQDRSSGDFWDQF